MTDRPYRIGVDRPRNLISINFDPVFWSMEVAKLFMGDVVAAVASLNCPSGRFHVLVDLRTAVIQSRDVYAKAQALVGSNAATRVALIASTPIARMQTKRLQLRENVLMFSDPGLAEKWLFGEVDQAA